jgi:hypothetical protein
MTTGLHKNPKKRSPLPDKPTTFIIIAIGFLFLVDGFIALYSKIAGGYLTKTIVPALKQTGFCLVPVIIILLIWKLKKTKTT